MPGIALPRCCLLLARLRLPPAPQAPPPPPPYMAFASHASPMRHSGDGSSRSARSSAAALMTLIPPLRVCLLLSDCRIDLYQVTQSLSPPFARTLLVWQAGGDSNNNGKCPLLLQRQQYLTSGQSGERVKSENGQVCVVQAGTGGSLRIYRSCAYNRAVALASAVFKRALLYCAGWGLGAGQGKCLLRCHGMLVKGTLRWRCGGSAKEEGRGHVGMLWECSAAEHAPCQGRLWPFVYQLHMAPLCACWSAVRPSVSCLYKTNLKTFMPAVPLCARRPERHVPRRKDCKMNWGAVHWRGWAWAGEWIEVGGGSERGHEV